MTQYIPKSAIVAEIKRRKKYYENIQMIKPVYESNIEDFSELLSFLDTFEVKEVDLEKEIKNEIDEYWYDNDYGAIQRHGGTITMEVSNVKEIAKHFFELGMQVSNKAQKEVEEYPYVGKTGKFTTTTK